MTLSTTSPLYATAVFNSTNSPCASPATSTDSHCDDVRALSPSTLAKLPGLQFAISHRRGDLRLPMLTHNRVYEPTASDNGVLNHPHHSRALYLSMPHCETPHYLPGVPLCPETSPLEKKSCSVDKELDANGKKRKKGTRRGTLNAEAKNVLKAWMFSPEHFAHPYPSEEEKEELALEAGIEVKQLSNWFTNARKRLWQPVLRQSGVEVKNFLSTGRGGPRGNKLDVPANLQHLIAQKEAEDEENGSPPSSPCPSHDGESKSLKRSWDDVHSSSLDDMVIKKKKTIVRKSSKDGKKMDEEELSHELRNALTTHLENHHPTVNKFKDIEILAAASLIGLHLQPMHQPVH